VGVDILPWGIGMVGAGMIYHGWIALHPEDYPDYD
jgi:hypothetical protein